MSNPDNTELREIDIESEQALLLEEAYNLGYHKVKNGCLIPLTEKLERQINALISKARIADIKDRILNHEVHPDVTKACRYNCVEREAEDLLKELEGKL